MAAARPPARRGPPRQRRARRAGRRAGRRRSPPRSPRGRSRAPARRRAAPDAERHRAAAPEPRSRVCGRRRSGRAAAPTAPAAARRAASSSAAASSASAASAAPGVELRLRRGERARSAPARVGRQLGRALQERRGGRDAAARLGPAGRPLQLAGHLLVGPGGRVRRDARPADRGPAARRSPRPARDGRRGARARAPPGRRPSAPADAGTAPARRSRPGPPPAAGSAASSPIPSRSAARHSSVTSPTGSAAASSSRRCVSAGSGSSRRRKLCSIRLRQRPRAGQPEPAGQLRRGQPARQLEQRERVAARLGDDPIADPRVERPGDRRVQQRAGRRRRPSPSITQLRQPVERGLVAGLAHREHQPDRARPAAGAPTNASVCADTRSSHCASSTTQTSGCSSATSASRLSTASPTRKRSGGGPALRPNAVLSASRCGPGRRPSRSSIGTHSGAGRRTRAPSRTRRPPPGRSGSPSRADDRYSSSAVLPTPASPRSTSTPALPRERRPHQPAQLLALAPTIQHLRRWEVGESHRALALCRPNRRCHRTARLSGPPV